MVLWIELWPLILLFMMEWLLSQWVKDGLCCGGEPKYVKGGSKLGTWRPWQWCGLFGVNVKKNYWRDRDAHFKMQKWCFFISTACPLVPLDPSLNQFFDFLEKLSFVLCSTSCKPFSFVYRLHPLGAHSIHLLACWEKLLLSLFNSCWVNLFGGY